MKKRLLLISLILVLVLTVIAPSTALAKAGKTWTGEFTATADVIVVDPGVTDISAWPTITTEDEIIAGEFTSADGWPTLRRGSLSVAHESTITLNLLNGTFAGTASADIVISFPGNSGELSGTYSANLTGNFDIVLVDSEMLIIILNVVDDGTFVVTGRDGGKSIEASGDWIANLFFTGETLAGTAIIDGEYQKATK